MPISVKLKIKERKFAEDRDKKYLVVSGPRELFTPKLEKHLFYSGLNGIPKSGEISIWSAKPTNAPPPLHLVGYLARNYKVKIDPLLRQMFSEALSPFEPEDNLYHFIGRSKSQSGGQEAIRVDAGSTRFIINCDERHWTRRALLDGAGWLPMESPGERIQKQWGSRPYTTSDPFIASNLDYLMRSSVKLKMNEMLRKAIKAIDLSKTQEAPEDFSIPAPEGLDYANFQKGGISLALSTGYGCIIADEMGLGKTIQAIGIINARPQSRNILIFCRANTRLNWVREIRKWLINKNLSVGHAEGDDWPDTDVVVINYDIAERHAERIFDRKWDLVFPDEAQSLVHEDAKRTQLILGDTRQQVITETIPMTPDGIMVHLSGTPRLSRTSDLWPLLSSTRPDLWGRGPLARQQFINRYEPPVLIQVDRQRNGRTERRIQAIPGEPIRELELQMRMRGSASFIRRLKRDTDMPKKTRTPLEMPFDLSEEDRECLAEVEADLTEILSKAAGRNINAGDPKEATNIINVIAGMKPKSPDFTETARVRKNLGVLKAPYAARYIADELRDENDIPQERRPKTVVFAHHKPVVKILHDHLQKDFPGQVLVYDGKVTSAARRQHLVDEFQNNPKIRCIIISLSGSTGITLTASYRERIVEPDWSQSNMQQVEDRIWRMGQEMPCDIGYLFVPNSLDVNIGMRLHEKTEAEEKTINKLSFSGMTGSNMRVEKQPAECEKSHLSEVSQPRDVNPASAFQADLPFE